MIRREEGFTLVELMITMVVFVLVIAAASNIFSSLLNQFKQQSKITESNIEGIVGLDMMRVDVQQAGFGIPWNLETAGAQDGLDPWTTLDANYKEAVSNAGGNADPSDASYYNDGTTVSAIPVPALQRAPRAVLAQDRAGIMPNTANTPLSDYLVVKSTNISLNAAGQKWTHITNNGAANLLARVWNDPNENLLNADRVVVERPVMGAQQRVLVMAAPPAFSTQFNAAFQPELDSFETHLIYGVDPDTDLRTPFNRADFYVSRPAPPDMPSQCAPNTGILYKAVMNQLNGRFQILPLLDCVADMQVVFITDVNADGVPEWNDADFPYTGALTAQQIRDQIKSVVIYILAHEGQRDPNFTFNNFSGAAACGATCIRVGDEVPVPGTLYGRDFDLSLIDPNFANYRWKVYKFAVPLPNLR